VSKNAARGRIDGFLFVMLSESEAPVPAEILRFAQDDNLFNIL
jgi:hypothetical protein